jgi:hypothetical protein
MTRRCARCYALVSPDRTACPTCGAAFAPALGSARPPVTARSGTGRLLAGRYRLDAQVAAGAMGAVWRVRDERLYGRRCAAKAIRIEGADAYEQAERRAYLKREAAALAGLHHPAICTILDLVEEAGVPYLILEWIDGRTLAEEVTTRGRPGLPLAEVLPWAATLADALGYLHGQRPPLIVRDLKPANIMRREDGRVTLIDLGLARASVAAGGTTIGTPGYAPPEQYQGIADARSDVYALGATLHHLLSGRDPERQQPFVFPRLDTLVPALPSGVAAVLDRALQMRADDRFPSVAAFATALREAAQGGDARPRCVPGAHVRPTWLDRRGPFGLPGHAVPSVLRPPRGGTVHQVLALGADLVVVIAEGGTSLWDLARGITLWTIGASYCCGMADRAAQRLALGTTARIDLWEASSGRPERRLAGYAGTVSRVVFSPDRGTLAAAGWGGVRLWDVASGRLLNELAGHRGWVAGLSFSPDGRTLASAGWDGSIRLWQVVGGRELHRLRVREASMMSVAFSPDGKLLAAGGSDGSVRRWETAGGREVGSVVGHPMAVADVAYSPDGLILASGGEDGRVRLWEASSGRGLFVLGGHGGPVRSIAFSPDGLVLASAGEDRTVRLWEPTSGRERRRLTVDGLEME